MLQQAPEMLTPRESVIMEYEKEEARLAREFEIRMKELDIQTQKLDIKWASWLRIPILLIKLPVYILFGFAFIVTSITKYELPKDFWEFLRR